MTISIEDGRAIEAVLVRYATAADERDAALLATCFTEDVQADFGHIGRFEGREALVGHLATMLASCGPSLHFVGNFTFIAEGDGVKSRCYTHAVVYRPGNDQPLRTAGTYDDRLRRTGDGWRIYSRIYTHLA